MATAAAPALSAAQVLRVRAQLFLLSQLSTGFSWTVARIGAPQCAPSTLTIVLSGQVRIGFDDNIYLWRGEPAASNTQFVERIAVTSRNMDRSPATRNRARATRAIERRREVAAR